jgi:hypothetical protein
MQRDWPDLTPDTYTVQRAGWLHELISFPCTWDRRAEQRPEQQEYVRLDVNTRVRVDACQERRNQGAVHNTPK